MANFTSVTISGNDVQSSTNQGAGEGLPGKVVPISPSHTAVDRINFSDGNSSHDTQRVSSVTMDGKGLEGLKSARTPFDTPIADYRDIDPKASVVFEGRRMLVSTAVDLGYLTMEGGQYTEVDIAAVKAQAATELANKQANVRTIDFNNDQGRDNLEALNAAGSPALTSALLHSVVGSMVDGADCNQKIDDFCSQTKADPVTLIKALNEMFNSQLEAVGKYVNERYGINSDNFVDYIAFNSPKQVRKQALLAGLHNDLGTIDQLVKAFKQGKKL